MAPVPGALLDGIAAQPDDPGVWEVLCDYLLEQDDPGATLARFDLELFRGISNPDLLGALVEARARRPRLPFEPYGGYDVSWRCGYVVRLQLSTEVSAEHVAPLLAENALRGLHHLRFEDRSLREGGRAFINELGGMPLPARLNQLCGVMPSFLRRFSLDLEERMMPVLSAELTRVLNALTAGLPKKVERVDLALTQLEAPSLEALGVLARRVRQLNLDGTRLTHLDPAALRRVVEEAPDCTFFLGGTWRSSRELVHPRVQSLAPEVVAWLEHEETGVVIPLTPSSPHDGFFAPAWRQLGRALRRELLGWSRVEGASQALIDDGAQLELDDALWRFHLR